MVDNSSDHERWSLSFFTFMRQTQFFAIEKSCLFHFLGKLKQFKHELNLQKVQYVEMFDEIE